jgi:ribosomal protein L36
MNSEQVLNSNLPFQTLRKDQSLKAGYLSMLGLWDTANKWDYPMSTACDGRYHHLITTQAQFRALEAQLRDELDTTYMLSLDFEHRDPVATPNIDIFDEDGYTRIGVILVVIGTVYTTYTFDIRQLRHDMGKEGRVAPIGRVLPRLVMEALASPQILVLGSGIRDDLRGRLEEMGIRNVSGIVDTQLVWAHAIKQGWIKANARDRARCGMDVQARWAFKIRHSHKPQKGLKMAEALRLPRHESFRMYEWVEPFNPHSLGYCNMDAKTPIKFVIKLLIRCLQRGWILVNRRSIADIIVEEIPRMAGGALANNDLVPDIVKPLDLTDLPNITDIVPNGHPARRELEEIQQQARSDLLFGIEEMFAVTRLDSGPREREANQFGPPTSTVPQTSTSGAAEEIPSTGAIPKNTMSRTESSSTIGTASVRPDWKEVVGPRRPRHRTSSSSERRSSPSSSRYSRQSGYRPRRTDERDGRHRESPRYGSTSRRSPRRYSKHRSSERPALKRPRKGEESSSGFEADFRDDRKFKKQRHLRLQATKGVDGNVPRSTETTAFRKPEEKPKPKYKPAPLPSQNAWTSRGNPALNTRSAPTHTVTSGALEAATSSGPAPAESDITFEHWQYVQERAAMVAQALQPEQLLQQAYAPLPSFIHICRSCGLDSCRRPNCTNLTNYPKCTYRHCKSNTHNITICDILHARCTLCKRRGHIATICAKHPAKQYFEDFEKFRLGGYYTRMADHSIVWGHFYVPKEILDHPKLPKYQDLLKMFGGQPEQIQQFLDSLAKSVAQGAAGAKARESPMKSDKSGQI